MTFHPVRRTNQMTTQFNNTGVKAETGFAQVIDDDAELQQASGGYGAMAIYAFIGMAKIYEKVTGNKLVPAR